MLLYYKVNSQTGKTWTYKELKDAVWRVSSALYRKGMRKDDVMLMLSENSVEYIITFLAAVSFGGIITPANPTSPEGTHLQ